MKSRYRDPNWKKLIGCIKKVTGWNNREVSEEAKIPAYTIYELINKSSKNVLYKTGAALVHLHERVTRKKR